MGKALHICIKNKGVYALAYIEFWRYLKKLLVESRATWPHTHTNPETTLAHKEQTALSVKWFEVSTSRAEDPGFESHLRRDFLGVESYQWL